MTRGEQFSAPVTGANLGRTPRRRRDPDEAPTPAPTAEPAPAPPPPAPGTGQALSPAPTGGQGLLANMLASNTTAEPGQHAGPVADILTQMARMRRRPVDPMQDYVGDGTRMLCWVQAALAHTADLTGRTKQEVVRDALIDGKPLPADILDAHFQDEYGYPRSAYRPPT